MASSFPPSDFKGYGLKVQHYRAFGEEPQGFEEFRPLNIIVGRNNSGKSSLLDIIEWVCEERTESSPETRNGYQAKIWIYQSYDQFSGIQNSRIQMGPSYYDNICFIYENHTDAMAIIKHSSAKGPNNSRLEKRINHLIQEKLKPNSGDMQILRLANDPPPAIIKHDRQIFKLSAERRILPESLNETSLDIQPNGTGATNLIYRFINDANLTREIITIDLLGDLNKVFYPDAHFEEIFVQRHSIDGKSVHEVYLIEKEKGAVPLSASGSGLQTVVLVLLALHVLPKRPDSLPELKKWVFAFEELENNLHPALQRRLFTLLRDRAVETGALIFLTTHSHIVIDLFADDPETQILHVTHDGTNAKVTPVLAHAGRRGVLDDLDVRASDLLQANSIIWVEGPTDRLYFNRWIDLWTDGELQEGRDYQCVFYGGRLLKHLNAEEPADVQKEAIEILRVNSRAIVLMDSDKTPGKMTLGETKQRIKDEIGNSDGYAWVTDGREIEHYIPHAAFESYFKKPVEKLHPLRDMQDYLNTIEGKPKRKSYDKLELAAGIIDHLTKDDLANHLDLKERLDEVVAKIKEWNRKA